ncbi:MAG: PHP domain-containing protein, partial [Flavobacteriales bacterium]
DKYSIDTKNESTEFCQLPGGRGGKFKWPNLSELYKKLFNESFAEAHNASADVEATTRCFLELIRIKVIPYDKVGMEVEDFQEFEKNNKSTIQLIGLNIQPYKSDDNIKEVKSDLIEEVIKDEIKTDSFDSKFSHLHVHSQYSVLQATGDVNSLINKAVEMNMPAIGLTDHANMFGSFKFVDSVFKHPINSSFSEDKKLKLKPILGCELNVCANHLDKSIKDYGAQIPFLAKNKTGYHNLAKLSSLAYVEGFYYVPRVDKDLILKYKEGLIVLSGSLYGSISNLILNVGESQAEDEFKWWVDNFGDNFYVEINRHGLEEEDHVNKILITLAKKYDVNILASNNVYYINKEDSYSHDILLCVKDGEQQSTPIGKGRGFRYGFLNNEFYFKSSKEMHELFSDIP